MRQLIENTVAANWANGFDEGLSFACYSMGWKCEQDDEQTQLSVGGRVIRPRVADEAFLLMLTQLSDEALLEFLKWQHCQEFR
jgi:hypothetical protein